ncbi:MAG: hypothetical protein ACKPCI_08410 [Dolichospermum sp.]
MGKYFDQCFTRLLESGDIQGARALLIKQYPHLKNDGDRVAKYIRLYQNHYCKGFEAIASRQNESKIGTVSKQK